MIVALAGGVGAARFLEGLINVVPPERVTVIVNTGDDIELYGLYISPDLDIIMYTIAGIVDRIKGWGIENDTFNCLDMLRTYGLETWFLLGDRDMATHIYRTFLLRQGLRLSEVVRILSKALGIKTTIIPMTDDRVQTMILTDSGVLHFEEYLVKRKARDRVRGVLYKGIEDARPAPGVIDAIMNADGIIICPSNPVVSIGTILSIKGIREALRKARAKIVGISPIVGGAPIKGPADKLMRGLGIEVSAYGVAVLYRDFLDYFIIDERDSHLIDRIESLGIKVFVTNTIMRSLEDKVRLARLAVSIIGLSRM
ncbi:MAG: 2-phospho-L-lactate transferase [Thermoprotei archaeon]|nr:MAG: 2-phospho-L-lactate transferase [Thermoprotei archaeon]RLE89573.1 MAG: 2-phospho-L-lactate transferase [Thermoprotei archaeon]